MVIPVRDRHAELARCLAGLAPASAPRVIVVDDGSRRPGRDPERGGRGRGQRGAAAGQRRRPRRPGTRAWRRRGRRWWPSSIPTACPAAGWLDALLPHFADPRWARFAPRIVPHEAGRTWLARYEGASSTLDMGRRPSIVRPGSRVPYVPGAALVVRREAAGTGFAEDMQVGEDVDFVWRLAASGWRVRYEPAATMGHQHRVRLRGSGSPGGRTTGPPRPCWNSGTRARSGALRVGVDRGGRLAAAVSHPEAGAVVTPGTSTALLATAAGPGSPAEPQPARPDRPRGGVAVSVSGGGRTWLRPARWAARSVGPGGRWRCLAAIAVRAAALPLAALVLAPLLLDWTRQAAARPARYAGRPVASTTPGTAWGVAGVRGTADRSAPTTRAARA